MRSLVAILAIGTLAGPATAQPIEWASATRVEVALSSFAFAPRAIHLRAGQPVVLHLVNRAGGGHNFAARDFFAASAVRVEDRSLVHNGVIEVAGGSVRDVGVIPRAGRYRLRCTHTLHTSFGMTGELIVD